MNYLRLTNSWLFSKIEDLHLVMVFVLTQSQGNERLRYERKHVYVCLWYYVSSGLSPYFQIYLIFT